MFAQFLFSDEFEVIPSYFALIQTNFAILVVNYEALTQMARSLWMWCENGKMFKIKNKYWNARRIVQWKLYKTTAQNRQTKLSVVGERSRATLKNRSWPATVMVTKVQVLTCFD